MKLKHAFFGGLAALLLTLGFSACPPPTQPPKPEPPQETNQLADNVHVLTSSEDAEISNVSGNSITFSQTPSYSPGDIIASDISDKTPDGLLRKVVSVSGNTVYTTQASLEDALKGVTVSFSSDATLNPSGKFVKSVSKAVNPNFDVPISVDLYDGDGDPYTKNDNISATGKLSVGSSFHLDFKFKKGTLENLTFTNRTNEYFNLGINSEVGKVNIIDKKVILSSFPLKPFTLGVIPTFPPIPIVIFPHLDTIAGISATDVSLGSGIGARQSTSLVAGASYANGKWSPVWSPSGDFDLYLPSNINANSVKVYLGPQLSFLLYDVAGPYGGADAYLRANTSDSKVNFYWGLEALVGVKGSIFGRSLFDYSVPLSNQEKLLKQVQLPNPNPSPNPTRPPINNSNYKILFVSGNSSVVSESDYPEIYTIDSNGTNLTKLTSIPYHSFANFQPCWSPDGTKIAFVNRSTNSSNGLDIYVMNADGSGITDITNSPGDETFPDWSTDGRIFFSKRSGYNYEGIRSIAPDGSDLEKIALPTKIDFSDAPRISPDGKKIAFEGNEDYGWNLYVGDINGTSISNLHMVAPGGISATWSPDGTQIAYDFNKSGNQEVYVVNVDGSSRKDITNNPAIDTSPTWSKDGRIAFISTRNTYYELYSMNPDGSGVIRIPTIKYFFNSTPKYSPTN